jgi:trafficking protein particle complex subunit 13
MTQRPLSPPVQGGAPIPYRPDSPFRRTTGLSLSTTPQSPIPTPLPPNPALRRPEETIDADLVVRHLPKDNLVVEKPFKIDCTVTISAPIPVGLAGQPRKERIVTLAVQHVLPARSHPKTLVSAPTTATAQDIVWSPKLPSSALSTPSPYGTPSRGDFPDTLTQRLLHVSPRAGDRDIDSDGGFVGDGQDTGQATPAPPARRNTESILTSISLPPPFAVVDTTNGAASSPHITPLGASSIILPSMRVHVPAVSLPSISGQGEYGHDRNLSESTVTDSESDSDLHDTIGERVVPKMLMSQDFRLEFLPLKAGFATVGGLRVLLVEDRLVDVEGGEMDQYRKPVEARTLKEWDVIAEVWVKSQTA